MTHDDGLVDFGEGRGGYIDMIMMMDGICTKEITNRTEQPNEYGQAQSGSNKLKLTVTGLIRRWW